MNIRHNFTACTILYGLLQKTYVFYRRLLKLSFCPGQTTTRIHDTYIYVDQNKYLIVFMLPVRLSTFLQKVLS